MKENRITRSGGILSLDDPSRRRSAGGTARAPNAPRAGGAGALAPALTHVPTLMQVRAMAHFEGREPSSYLLDPAVNLRARAAAWRRGPAGPSGAALQRPLRRWRPAL